MPVFNYQPYAYQNKINENDSNIYVWNLVTQFFNRIIVKKKKLFEYFFIRLIMFSNYSNNCKKIQITFKNQISKNGKNIECSLSYLLKSTVKPNTLHWNCIFFLAT